MTDLIIERLRASIRDLASGAWDSPEGRLIAEAADEIERLTAVSSDMLAVRRAAARCVGRKAVTDLTDRMRALWATRPPHIVPLAIIYVLCVVLAFVGFYHMRMGQ